MAVHLYLLVVAFILLVPTPQQAQGNVSRFSPMDDLSVCSDLSPQTQIVPIRFNVARDDYQTFLGNLFRVLADTPTHRYVGGIPVLAQQRKDSVPARWICVEFVAAWVKTTIAIRDDNIYIEGFTNRTGSWFAFKNRAHLIRDSTELMFNGGYKDLVGHYTNLKDLKLGKKNMLEAVRRLTVHHPNHDDSNDQTLKHALAKLCVMVAEAERFVPIMHAVAQGWKGTPQITALQTEYVVRWCMISRALLEWQKTHDWKYKRDELWEKVRINGPLEASSTLGLVLWPNDFECRFDAITADDDGKPLADDSSTTCNGTSCN